MVAMWHFADLAALYALVGAAVSECIGYVSYNLKATKENTKGGIVYDSAMKDDKAVG